MWVSNVWDLLLTKVLWTGYSHLIVVALKGLAILIILKSESEPGILWDPKSSQNILNCDSTTVFSTIYLGGVLRCPYFKKKVNYSFWKVSFVAVSVK